MVCTFEVVLALTLTGHSLGQELLLTHVSKEGGVAPKPPDPSCTVARLDVSPFYNWLSETAAPPKKKKTQLHCLLTYTNTH